MARPDAFAVYAETRHLADALTAAGQAGWADRLTDAIAQGSTSGEILMAIGHELDQLIADRSHRSIPSELRSEAKRVRRLVARCFTWR